MREHSREEPQEHETAADCESEPAEADRSDRWHQTYAGSDPLQNLDDQRATYFARLFRDAPAAYVVTDAAMRILDANGAAQKLWNRTLSALRTRPMWTMVSKDDRSAFQGLMPELMTRGMVMTRPLRIQPSEGQELNVFFTASAARDEAGKAEAIFWIFLQPLESWESDIL